VKFLDTALLMSSSTRYDKNVAVRNSRFSLVHRN